MNLIDNSQRTAAKIAGWSGLLTFAIVVIGNYMLLNPLVVPGDAVATAQNIVAHQTQFRITVVCFLTYSLGVIVLLTALYVIFKPINPGLALTRSTLPFRVRVVVASCTAQSARSAAAIE